MMYIQVYEANMIQQQVLGNPVPPTLQELLDLVMSPREQKLEEIVSQMERKMAEILSVSSTDDSVKGAVSNFLRKGKEATPPRYENPAHGMWKKV